MRSPWAGSGISCECVNSKEGVSFQLKTKRLGTRERSPPHGNSSTGGTRKVYLVDNRPGAIEAFKEWRRRRAQKYPGLSASIQEDLGKLLAFFSCPRPHWRYIRTNSPIERLMRDIRARTYGWAGFANKDSCERLLYGLFYRRNKDWEDKPKLEFTHRS